MATLASLDVRLGLDAADFESGLATAESKLKGVGEKMSSVGKGLTTKVSLPLAGIGGTALKMASDFNAGMADVSSLGDEAFQKVPGWKSEVQELAVDVGKGTDDMSEGLYNVVSAFGAGDDAMEILGINARAATGGLAETTEAINLTSAVTKGYGDTSAEAVQKASDLALKTVQLGQTTFPELASSIGRVTPLAAALGVKQEELFGVMATGTGVTGSAAEVSTQLRGVLQSLSAPTDTMAGLISDMGYESGQALLEQEGLQGAISAVVQAAEDTGTPLQSYIGSIEGQTLAMALAGPQADTFTEKLAAMETAAGATDAAFKAQTEGINAAGFETQQAGIKMQVAAQKLGDGLTPALTAAIEAATPLIDRVVGLADAFANADPKVQTTIVTIAAIVGAVGPVLTIVGTLISTFGTVVGVAGTVVGAISGAAGLIGTIAALANPIGIIVGAVAGLAIAWKTNFLGIQDKTRTVVNWIAGKIGPWIDKIVGFFSDLKNRLVGNSIVPEMVAAIIGKFTDLRDKAAEIVTALKEATIGRVVELKDQAVAKVTALKDSALETVTALKDTAVTRATELRDTAVTRATELKDTAIERFTSLKDTGIERFTSLKDTGIERATALKDDVVSRATELKDTAIERFTTLKETSVERLTSLKDSAVTLATEIRDDPVGKLTELKDTGIARFTTLKDSGIEKLTALKDTGLSQFAEFKTTAVERATALKDEAIGKFMLLRDGAVEKIEGLKTQAGDILDDMVEDLKETLTGAVEDVKTAAKAIGDAIMSGIGKGIDAAKEWLKGKAEAIAGWLPGWVKKRLGIGSPSRVFYDEVGGPIAEGIVLGWSDGLMQSRPQVDRAVSNWTDHSRRVFERRLGVRGSASGSVATAYTQYGCAVTSAVAEGFDCVNLADAVAEQFDHVDSTVATDLVQWRDNVIRWFDNSADPVASATANWVDSAMAPLTSFVGDVASGEVFSGGSLDVVIAGSSGGDVFSVGGGGLSLVIGGSGGVVFDAAPVQQWGDNVVGVTEDAVGGIGEGVYGAMPGIDSAFHDLHDLIEAWVATIKDDLDDIPQPESPLPQLARMIYGVEEAVAPLDRAWARVADSQGAGARAVRVRGLGELGVAEGGGNDVRARTFAGGGGDTVHVVIQDAAGPAATARAVREQLDRRELAKRMRGGRG